MIEWINIALLVIATFGMTYYYIKSVSPAKLEKKIGEIAYKKCGNYRIIASIFESITIINFVLYFYLPLPITFPRYFLWDYWISVILGIIILVPSLYIVYRGLKDAGREALFPDKSHTLYTGIYDKIRHPQALGESFVWWAAALLLNSPFLFLYSAVWFPIFYWLCIAEERDLELRYGEKYTKYKQRTGMFFPKKRA
jgi:protein-S-isoprenylcysteine O-methyltransferase Ste14